MYWGTQLSARQIILHSFLMFCKCNFLQWHQMNEWEKETSQEMLFYCGFLIIHLNLNEAEEKPDDWISLILIVSDPGIKMVTVPLGRGIDINRWPQWVIPQMKWLRGQTVHCHFCWGSVHWGVSMAISGGRHLPETSIISPDCSHRALIRSLQAEDAHPTVSWHSRDAVHSQIFPSAIALWQYLTRCLIHCSVHFFLANLSSRGGVCYFSASQNIQKYTTNHWDQYEVLLRRSFSYISRA